MGALVGRYHRRIAYKREVYTGVWNQVRLEFVEIDVEGTIESQTRRDGADHLSNETVQVLEAGSLDI